jgi:hypothetical protein
LDTTDLIYRMRAGLGNWQRGTPIPNDAYRFLDDLISAGTRLVTNSVVLAELTAGGHDNGLLIKDWLEGKVSFGEIDLHILSQAEYDFYAGRDGGEKSLVQATSKHPNFTAPVVDVRFLSGEDFSRREYFTDAGYSGENFRTGVGLQGERYALSGSDADFARGADYVRAARAAGIHENAIFGKPLGENKTFADNFRAILHDESGAATYPNGKHWDELSDYVKNNKLLLAGEAVGVAAIIADAAATREAVIKALARGDIAAADELLGGLIGRSFGGAFAAAVAGATGGSLFGPLGAIVGAIAGGIVGAAGGGDIGEWIARQFNGLGFSLSDAIDDLADLLRDILSDPIVLDLDGDGIELTSLASSDTFFDLDADGFAERTGWVGPHDGLLFHDADGDGAVDGVAELFGSASVDGYDELRPLDANGDNRIDAADPAFAALRIWRDLDGNGASSPDEVLTLAQAGIARLNLSYSQVDQNAAGNVIARLGSYVRTDGTSRGSVPDFLLAA